MPPPAPRQSATASRASERLVIRDLFLGLRRFEDLQRDLGVARNVLTDRLGRLVEEEIVERRLYDLKPAPAA
jgi:DNA-binding HxlR family transcriptional regulator